MLLRKINTWGETYYEIPEVTGPACPFMLFWKVNEHPLYKHESYFSWNKWPQQTDFHQQQPLSYWGLQCSNSLPCWYFRHRPHPHLHLLISFTPFAGPPYQVWASPASLCLLIFRSPLLLGLPWPRPPHSLPQNSRVILETQQGTMFLWWPGK